MDVIHKPSSEVHLNADARILESPDSRLRKSQRVMLGTLSFDRPENSLKATIDMYFFEQTVYNILSHRVNNTMVECFVHFY